MGQAKRRGSFSERYAQAKARQEQALKEQNMALTKPLPNQPKPHLKVGTVGQRRIGSPLLLTALVSALCIPPRNR